MSKLANQKPMPAKKARSSHNHANGVRLLEITSFRNSMMVTIMMMMTMMYNDIVAITFHLATYGEQIR